MTMQIIEYFSSPEKEQLIEKIEASDWTAGRFLGELLRNGTFFDMLGGTGEVFLLMDGDDLASFLTLTGQDSIRDETMTPWVGFVFTFPQHRGHRYAGILLEHAEKMAASRGHQRLYIATDHVGLYEKYGYTYLENRIDYWGSDERILFKELG
jgi:GNAT superfamily N-acetyltransferase